MTQRRVFRPPSVQQEDRLPIASYEDAIWRLVQIGADPVGAAFGYDVAVKLVADLYWLSDARVRRDANRRIREVTRWAS